jgi:hypothetical protein
MKSCKIYEIRFAVSVCNWSWGSSVNTVLTMDWATGRSGFDPRQGQKIFTCSLCVRTGSWAHPASCPMGTRCFFPGSKALPGRDPDHSPHLVSRLRMSRSYTSSPPSSSMACIQAVPLYYKFKTAKCIFVKFIIGEFY